MSINALHTEPRAARLYLLACRSPRPGERCRYPTTLQVALPRRNEPCLESPLFV